MIIDFSVSNFRSIRNEQSISFEANGSNSKQDNLIIDAEKKQRLLKSILIYGANASGKTNFIRALFTLRNFILNSTDYKKGDEISGKHYDPFIFNTISENSPALFKITFIARDKKLYKYEVKYDRKNVIEEKLIVYETNQPSTLFKRVDGQESVTIGDKFEEKVDTTVLHNNLFLSKIGNSPNKQLGDLYLYFKEDIQIWNISSNTFVNSLTFQIKKIFANPSQEIFRKRLIKLINIADTKIESLYTEEASLEEALMPPAEFRKDTKLKNIYHKLYSVHKKFNDVEYVTDESVIFSRIESLGSNALFSIGGLIVHSLLKNMPVVIGFDEYDNSLHPELCRFLLELFHHPLVNTNNSQMLLATHETQLLDKDLVRKDQIWLTEKNKYGESEIFSVSDFSSEENIREGIPFDKWYKQGKFGGIPNIKKTEFFADYET